MARLPSLRRCLFLLLICMNTGLHYDTEGLHFLFFLFTPHLVWFAILASIFCQYTQAPSCPPTPFPLVCSPRCSNPNGRPLSRVLAYAILEVQTKCVACDLQAEVGNVQEKLCEFRSFLKDMFIFMSQVSLPVNSIVFMLRPCRTLQLVHHQCFLGQFHGGPAVYIHLRSRGWNTRHPRWSSQS